MAPKAKAATKRAAARKGAGVARAASSLTVEGGADGEQVPQGLGIIPEDPEDPRLTVAGVVLAGDGKVDVPAYQELFSCFAGEPAPFMHPHPETPGVRQGEKVPKGLRIWDDERTGATEKKGAGWIAVRQATSTEKRTEKWFNMRICGSWRMAFLLARLQRQYWDAQAAWLNGDKAKAAPSAEKNGAAGKAKASPSTEKKPAAALASGGELASTAVQDVPVEQAPKQVKPPDTPRHKRPRDLGDEEGAEKKPRVGTMPQMAQTPQKVQKPGLITADALAGSVRLREIMAARQKAAAAAAAAGAAAKVN